MVASAAHIRLAFPQERRSYHRTVNRFFDIVQQNNTLVVLRPKVSGPVTWKWGAAVWILAAETPRAGGCTCRRWLSALAAQISHLRLHRPPRAAQPHALAVARGGAAEQGSPSFRSALELRESDDYMR